MSRDPNEVVKLYSGSLVEVETYEQVLKEAGIECRVVGTALTSVFGNAIPDTVELWTHRGDAEKATEAIEFYEKESKVETRPPQHPANTAKPKGTLHYRKERYVNPDPRGE